MAEAGPGVPNSVEALVGPRASASMASVAPAVEPLLHSLPGKGSNGTGLRIQMFPGLLAFFL